MCPACFATAATVFAGATSAAGVAAVIVSKLGGKSGSASDEPTRDLRGEDHASAENRFER